MGDFFGFKSAGVLFLLVNLVSAATTRVTSRISYNFNVIKTSHVLCKHSNGEQASLANLKLTIGSLLACS